MLQSRAVHEGEASNARWPVEQIQITAEQTAAGFVVHLAGDADGEQVDELDRQLRLISNLKPKLLVLDLAKLNFLSSVGMGLLVRIQNQLKDSGGRLVLAAPRPLIREALRRAALQRIFEIRDSVDEVK
jgi:anti-sigma B factor antagonist/stage II sporulation protein AA (anti-sigma F factor antagonist)